MFRSFITALFLLSNSIITSGNNNVNFLGLGDWGGYSLGSYHTKNVKSVANAIMDDKYSYLATLNTGDNFYYCGIQNLEDENINEDYITLFSNISTPWISALGNHDYGYNVSAQLKLDKIIPNWIMPNRYYKTKIEQNDMCFDIYVLDTNPCIQDYRNNDPKYWDPCSTEYPTCTPYKNPEPCRFHENILNESCTEQYNWLNAKLYNEYNSTCWNIMIGHHTIYEINVENFGNLINKYADIYLNGHVHIMGVYEYLGKNKYITTGAAAMVSEDVEINNKNSYIWYNKTTGYTRHIFNKTTIKTEFIDSYSRKIIYDVILQKV
jgi:tartrate-resistant acid phosphatase type 5